MVFADTSGFSIYKVSYCPESPSRDKSGQSLDNCALECDSDSKFVGMYLSFKHIKTSL